VCGPCPSQSDRDTDPAVDRRRIGHRAVGEFARRTVDEVAGLRHFGGGPGFARGQARSLSRRSPRLRACYQHGGRFPSRRQILYGRIISRAGCGIRFRRGPSLRAGHRRRNHAPASSRRRYARSLPRGRHSLRKT